MRSRTLPLDAIPDLSDTQVIVYTEYPGQAPQVVEDQVTYPLTTAMLTVPKSKVVRGFSFFGVSFVYVIFEDGTDIYWARSRVLEYLNAAARAAAGRRHADARTRRDRRRLGLPVRGRRQGTDRSPSCARCRTGRSATGSPRPRAWPKSPASAASSSSTTSSSIRSGCASFGIPLSKVRDAIRASNMDVGGRTVELSEFEYVVRGRGYLKGIADLREDRAEERGRHAGALCGTSRASSLARTSGAASPSSTAKARWRAASSCSASAPTRSTSSTASRSGSPRWPPACRSGVEIVPVYDRSKLIHAAIETLKPDADRGKPRRRAGVHRVPAACPQRAGRDPDAAGRRPDGVRGYEGAWASARTS